MTPERVAALVRHWVRAYTWPVSPSDARRRVAEVDADLHDHLAHARGRGTSDRRVAVELLSRMLGGVVADAMWCHRHLDGSARPAAPGPETRTDRRIYRRALAAGVLTLLFLVWSAGALGILNEAGDPADLLYGGVLAVGMVGAAFVRLRPLGMARVLVAMAGTQAAVTFVALAGGLVESNPLVEILGINGMFVMLHLGAAALFWRAAHPRHPADVELDA